MKQPGSNFISPISNIATSLARSICTYIGIVLSARLYLLITFYIAGLLLVHSFEIQSVFPIPRARFTQFLNDALDFCNLDCSKYKAHSFRIGATSWAAAKGLSDTQTLRYEVLVVGNLMPFCDTLEHSP